MKRYLILSMFFLAGISQGVVEIGEKAPELCWKGIDNQEICTRNLKGKVAVLVYSTGWCPGCQDEIAELSKRYPEIKNSGLLVASLSAEGMKPGQPVNDDFLKAWKEKYSIPFEVLASPKNAGKEFFEPPYYIPATVILNKDGLLAFKKVDAKVDEIFSKVRELLP